jgi:hypothetical protein
LNREDVSLPFTGAQFLQVFADYNAALWPWVAALWIVTLVLAVGLMRGRVSSLPLVGLLVVHWAWSGIAYHALFFSRVNPAAWIFAALFVGQACALAWLGLVRRRLTFGWGRAPRHRLAGAFILYSLAYPALVLASGHQFPSAPGFAVPCPTTLFTAGVLLAGAPPVPRSLVVVPALWSFIGGSAALLFGMTPDLMLFVAGACLTLYALKATALR